MAEFNPVTLTGDPERSRNISFTQVGTLIRAKLAQKLDIMDHIDGRDWRGLADKLGFSYTQIKVQYLCNSTIQNVTRLLVT